MFWLKLLDLFKRLGWLLAIYFVLRLAFVLLNFSQFREADLPQFLWAFVLGLRFDLAAICMVNAGFIFFSLLPFPFSETRAYQGFLKALFLIPNLPFLVLNLIDLEYFKFIGRRTSNELFTITADIQTQTGQLFLNYWYIPLLALALLLFMVKCYPFPVKKSGAKQNQKLNFFGTLTILALTVMLIRGGWQLKPVRPANAFVQEPAILGHVSLNSTFTFIKSISQPVLEPKTYFSSRAEMLQALAFDPEKYQTPGGKPLQENVVLIILESFASEYTGVLNNEPRFTPFFDSLAAQGSLYRYNYANGRKSIEALPSLLAGLPSLLHEPYITSSFQSNEMYGIGTIARENGYHTSFYHGAANGTMGFNAFARIAGFQKYYGLNQYPRKLRNRDFD
ncbi:MAG TPA: sulfatase-like hydrolase/transferase, partial [Adhaeribacter sp.]|nr:sulfatase-like hydrolase/transferase [Adhaeribacter sp.]